MLVPYVREVPFQSCAQRRLFEEVSHELKNDGV